MTAKAAAIVTSPAGISSITVNDTVTSVFDRYSWVGLLAVHGPTALQVSHLPASLTYNAEFLLLNRIAYCSEHSSFYRSLSLPIIKETIFTQSEPGKWRVS